MIIHRANIFIVNHLLEFKMIANIHKFLLTAAVVTASIANAAEINEDVLMRHDDARESRDRILMAELAHARATNALDMARFVFDLDSRLYQVNAVPRLTLLESQLRLRQAQIGDRVAHNVKATAMIEEQIDNLRASWRGQGGSSADLVGLAKLLVEKRKLRVAMIEGNLGDFTDIAKVRNEIYQTNKEALASASVSQQQVQESYYNARQSNEDVSISSRDLAFAKASLEDALKDLAAASQR